MTTDPLFTMPDPPKLPASGKEFFNVLMAQIEPDLTSDHVHTLADKYDHETPEEHAARLRRYKDAFAQYRKQRDQYFAIFQEQVRKFSRELKQHSEAAIREVEERHLHTIESYFQ